MVALTVHSFRIQRPVGYCRWWSRAGSVQPVVRRGVVLGGGARLEMSGKSARSRVQGDFRHRPRIPLPTMLYRFLRGINEIYPKACLLLFIGLFLVAFTFTMVYPLVPIVLIISSVYLVVVVRCGYLALKWAELKVARNKLAQGMCPACGVRCDKRQVAERSVHDCPGCRRGFTDTGEAHLPQESAETLGNSSQVEYQGNAVAAEGGGHG